MKVVLVHDWLIHMRGGERVLESLAELYPDAPIYTLFHDRAKLSPSLRDRVIHSSFLHHLPGIKRYYRWLLPFLPQIIKTLGAKEADLVLSTSHCVAKGVPVPQGALHVCYCHTPMRYLWGFGEDYFGNMPFFLKPVISWILSCLRGWDVNVNKGVDYFISNSHNVAERIRRYYGRDSEVIHPPVDTRFFHPVAAGEDFYLVVSAFVPYKKVDVVIQAFNELDRPLKIVGAGPLEQAYKSLASAPKIEFLGSVSDEKLRELHSRARALIFPTEEDFGIVPLEAQACGTPVIALKKGGALESVKTGLFFEEQTAECLREAVRRFETMRFDRGEAVRRMADFDKQRFKEKIAGFVNGVMEKAGHGIAKA